MKFLADESVDYPIVKALRDSGLDTDYIADGFSGMADEDVIALANKNERILLTADKDFGELVYRMKLTHKGVILYRLSGYSNTAKALHVKEIIIQHQDKLENSFTLINKTIVKIKTIP